MNQMNQVVENIYDDNELEKVFSYENFDDVGLINWLRKKIEQLQHIREQFEDKYNQTTNIIIDLVEFDIYGYIDTKEEILGKKLVEHLGEQLKKNKLDGYYKYLLCSTIIYLLIPMCDELSIDEIIASFESLYS